ncbi:MAG: membrane protein insertion efficiency factor YidD [Ruminococcus sp.]|jgi:putative membrane protein insertion efficiency factor|nr:membrane protein insertion efficiency factor YidD [Ruminococcus sp.]
MKKILLRLIDFYQKKISPRTSRKCRYYPTCSAYAKEAVTLHGAAKGTILTALRLLRCNPLFSGGVDKVPKDFENYMKAMIGFGRLGKSKRL